MGSKKQRIYMAMILPALVEQQPLRGRDFVRICRASWHGLANELNRLWCEGLVERSRDGKYTLTDEGRKAAAGIKPPRKRNYRGAGE
jgi:Mn-dependent DtxR family transcriptional regulator